MKHPKRLGMSCKNTKFIKASLTPAEAKRAAMVNKADRDRWAELMAKPWNKWQPDAPTTTEKSSKRSSKHTPPA